MRSIDCTVVETHTDCSADETPQRHWLLVHHVTRKLCQHRKKSEDLFAMTHFRRKTLATGG